MGTQPNHSESFNRQVTGLIAEISTLCTLINFHTEYACFLRIEAHVSRIQVRICKDKIYEYNTTIANSEFYYSETIYSEEEIIKELTGMKLSLKKILHDRKIDYSQLDYSEHTEIIREYKLYPSQDFKVKP